MKYYWRVRPRGPEGLWGRWSKIWQFTWAGPGVVVRLAVDPPTECGKPATLRWGSVLLFKLYSYSSTAENNYLARRWNASNRVHAEPPVHYEVYGSNESGSAHTTHSEPFQC